ncbi:MAG: pentapeptide repeat-containing protein [Rhodospirillales bacterium]|nr:pentapeptide repeat-containing protein [Rhodospirillales bacterium]
MIEGISAYQVWVDANSLRVSPNQPSGSLATSQSSNNPRVIEDVITLSKDAQQYLEVQSRSNDIATGSEQAALLSARGNLIGSGLSGQNLSGTNLTDIYLFKADLSNAVFDQAILNGAWLAEANLTGASFIGADLRGANLSGATGLSAEQLAYARVDGNTVLPIGVALE